MAVRFTTEVGRIPHSAYMFRAVIRADPNAVSHPPIVPDARQVPGLPEMPRQGLTLDLFDPPRRERIRLESVRLAAEGPSFPEDRPAYRSEWH